MFLISEVRHRGAKLEGQKVAKREFKAAHTTSKRKQQALTPEWPKSGGSSTLRSSLKGYLPGHLNLEGQGVLGVARSRLISDSPVETKGVRAIEA